MISPYPTQSDAIEKVAAAVGAAQLDIGTLAKDGKGFSGNFTTFETLKAGVYPVLHSHALTVVQFMLPWLGEPMRMFRTEIKRDVAGKDVTHREFKIEIATLGIFRTQFIHNSGQWMASDWPICAEWGAPQDVGIQVGHFKRYAIEAFLGIAKADEPAPRGERRERSQTAPRSAPSPQAPLAKPVAPEPVPVAPAAQERPPWDDLEGVADAPPGSSGPALFTWLYDRGGVNDATMAESMLPFALGQGFPAEIRDWSPEQAQRGFDYCQKKLKRRAELAAASAARETPKKNGFKELAGMSPAAAGFNEFGTNGN